MRYLLVLPFLAACAPAPTLAPDAAFHLTLSQRLCGETLTGAVVSTQPDDADWQGKTLTLGPVMCASSTDASDGEDGVVSAMVMPLAVGEDTSRTWLLLNTEQLEFRHIHFEPDGSPSAVTLYGGPAAPGGTATQQSFPADAATKANFTANGIARSNPNIWTLTLDENAGTLTYALARPATDTAPARDFRAQFALPE